MMKRKTRLVSVLALALGALAAMSPQAVQAQARPATSTREVAPPGHEPYATSFGVTVTNLNNSVNGYSPDPVPLNKRLVIEFVSVLVNGPAADNPGLALQDSVNGASRFYRIPLTPVAGGHGFAATQLVKLYHDGNGVNGPGAFCLRDFPSLPAQVCSISLSGYLIDK